MQKFTASGTHHILIGPDHLLFLIGLLLLGGSIRHLAVVVSAFTLAHSITLSLAALNIVDPPSSVIEPAIALSIVFIGVDNLLVRGERDLRAWIAFAFGFVHGFGFAGVLNEMGLESQALIWSLLSFNLGVEIGQLLVVVVVASAFAMLRTTSKTVGRRLAFAGSLGVIGGDDVGDVAVSDRFSERAQLRQVRIDDRGRVEPAETIGDLLLNRAIGTLHIQPARPQCLRRPALFHARSAVERDAYCS